MSNEQLSKDMSDNRQRSYKMSENLLTIPTWQKGCIEEMVILNESRDVLKYSFSNSLDDIKIAIYARTGHSINLEKAVWRLNPRLSISVKHLMNSHNVIYSMTTYIRDKEKSVVVNMRVGDKWYITGYDEVGGRFISWEFFHIYSEAQKIVKHMLNDSDSSPDNDTDDMCG
jgi:hypothetical protein